MEPSTTFSLLGWPFVFLVVFAAITMISVVCLLGGPVSYKTSIVLSSFVVVFSRSIPVYSADFLTTPDSFYYALADRNVYDFGTIVPHAGAQPSLTESILNWPVYHVSVASFAHISGLPILECERIFPLLLGLITFLTVLALFKRIVRSEKLALIAALVGCSGGVVAFYQAESVQQGLAFCLMAGLLLTANLNSGFRTSLMMILVFVVLLLSHRFSGLLMTLVIGVWVVLSLLPGLSRARWPEHLNPFRTESGLPGTWILAALLAIGLTFHVIVFSRFSQEAFLALSTLPPVSAAIAGSQPLNYYKWILVFVALPSIVAVTRCASCRPGRRMLVVLVSFIIAGIVGNYVLFSPLDRIIGLATTVASVFSLATVGIVLMSGKPSSRSSMRRRGILVMILVLLLCLSSTMSIFSSYASQPNLYTPESAAGTLPSPWCSRMNQYSAAGTFLNETGIEGQQYFCDSFTYITLFYFASLDPRNAHTQTTYEWALSGMKSGHLDSSIARGFTVVVDESSGELFFEKGSPNRLSSSMLIEWSGEVNRPYDNGVIWVVSS
jgi:hypothetical protein